MSINGINISGMQLPMNLGQGPQGPGCPPCGGGNRGQKRAEIKSIMGDLGLPGGKQGFQDVKQLAQQNGTDFRHELDNLAQNAPNDVNGQAAKAQDQALDAQFPEQNNGCGCNNGGNVFQSNNSVNGGNVFQSNNCVNGLNGINGAACPSGAAGNTYNINNYVSLGGATGVDQANNCFGGAGVDQSNNCIGGTGVSQINNCIGGALGSVDQSNNNIGGNDVSQLNNAVAM